MVIFFSFSPEFSIKERRNNFRTLQTSRAALLTYLDWLVPLKFLFGFDSVFNNVNIYVCVRISWMG